VADALGDLFALRARALAEQVAQELARLLGAPPVGAEWCDEVAAERSRPDPRTQVVGGVEARVHVREEVVRAVVDARRLAELLGAAVRRAAVRREAAPHAG